MNKELFENAVALIRGKLLQPIPGEDIEHFLKLFKKKFGDHLLAVLHYGSFLSDITRKEDSFRDFFVVVDSFLELKGFSQMDKLLSTFLPPNLYYYDEVVDGTRYVCKYNVITIYDFNTYTSFYPPDNYLLGRFSKRMALLYYRDEKVIDEIATGMARSAFFTGEKSFFTIVRPVTVEEWIMNALSFSYMAEERIEDFSVKSRELYLAAKEYYNKLYGGIILKNLEVEGVARYDYGTGLLFPAMSREEFINRKKEIEEYLRISRVRTRLRWPKMILTVDKWVDQLLWKLERVHGIKLDISPWERKIILITGWRYYFILKKKGKVK